MKNNMKDKPKERILVIDDDRAVCHSIALLTRKHGYETESVHHPSEVMDKIELFNPHLIMLDMNFTIETSGRQGLSLLKRIYEVNASIPVILMTGWATVQLAVEGMKLGAKDFLAKPWDNTLMIQSIRSILHLYPPERSDPVSYPETSSDMVGQDSRFKEVLDMAYRVAPTDASVLILGESGTGKELLAEAIHINSPRSNRDFVKVNLGGISTSLFESEMFGHKKGSFTDAYADRVGRFATAHQGTIFLDEIGELPLENQVKLLRVLQEKRFEQLGDTRSQKSDFRLVSATNKDLSQLVNQGLFREDLFYRINLITLYLPPLRERRSDIPGLVEHFARKLESLYQQQLPVIVDESLAWLSNQDFPGNIRELKNQVERTILLNLDKKELLVKDFQEMRLNKHLKSSAMKLPAVGMISLEEMEVTMIKRAMQFHDGNISQAARSLGITRSALYRRLEKYNIPHASQN